MLRAGSASVARSMNRRDFLKLSGAGLAGAALLGAAGCGGGGGGGGQGGGPVEVIFSFGPDESGTLQEVISRFNEERQGEIQVNYREMPADTGQYFDQLRTEFQAGGGDIDVIGGDVIWPAQFAANGWILDLSDRFPEDERQNFLDGPIQANTYNDSIWGVPWFTDAGMMYYRQDLLEQSGFSEPPATWDELKEMALQVQQDAGTQFGFIFQGAQYEGGVVDGLEYIWTHGGDALSEDGTQVIINENPAVAGLEMERSMVEDGVAPEAVSSYKEQDSHAAFLRGDAVFLRNWPYVYALAADESQSEISQDQIGVAPLPVSGNNETASGLGGWNFYINAASEPEVQDAAYEFIQFATSSEIQKFRALEGSFLPTLTELYDDQEIQETVPVVALGREALESSKPRPVSPVYSDLSLVMQEQFNASLRGAKSPQQAADDAANEMQSIVERAENL